MASTKLHARCIQLQCGFLDIKQFHAGYGHEQHYDWEKRKPRNFVYQFIMYVQCSGICGIELHSLEYS